MDPHSLMTLVGLAFLAKVVHDAQMDTEFMKKLMEVVPGESQNKKIMPGGAKMVPLSVLPHGRVSRGPKWRAHGRPDGPFL